MGAAEVGGAVGEEGVSGIRRGILILIPHYQGGTHSSTYQLILPSLSRYAGPHSGGDLRAAAPPPDGHSNVAAWSFARLRSLCTLPLRVAKPFCNSEPTTSLNRR